MSAAAVKVVRTATKDISTDTVMAMETVITEEVMGETTTRTVDAKPAGLDSTDPVVAGACGSLREPDSPMLALLPGVRLETQCSLEYRHQRS